MLTRCFNERCSDYFRYGGRGITVCDRWANSFEAFFVDMGCRPSAAHSLDRINNQGNYEPDNCRWATKKEQSRNQSTNNIIEFNGIRKSVAEWAEEFGLKADTIRKRLAHGMSVSRALTHPATPSGDQVRARARDRTHCPNGHEFTEANTYIGKGGRKCRTCGRNRATQKRMSKQHKVYQINQCSS